ncbi:MAG: hypothetical protein HZA08_05015 [Nitrospirae bacterium]|nr:hypothetical protein [Nitrospirota bacterium]
MPDEPVNIRGLTKGDEDQRDKNVPPILIKMDRRGFLTPPEERDLQVNSHEPRVHKWP